MGVCGNANALTFVANFNTPYLSKPEKKPLVWCEPVYFIGALSLLGQFEGLISQGNTTEVGQVFTQCKAAIQVQIVAGMAAPAFRKRVMEMGGVAAAVAQARRQSQGEPIAAQERQQEEKRRSEPGNDQAPPAQAASRCRPG